MIFSGEGWRAEGEVGASALVSLTADADLPTFFEQHALVPEREVLPSRRMWLVRDARGTRDGLQLAQALTGAEGVAFVEADVAYRRVRDSMPVPPNDARYSGQWYLKKVNIEGAWATTTGSSKVTIQVIDNGCDTTHPDLAPHLLQGRDVIDRDDDPSVTESGLTANHGTACAGIVGAVGNNGIGIAGACPECMVRCVRFLDENEPVPISADVDAMRFALEHDDVAVVSNSWSFGAQMPVPLPLKAAIEDVSHMGHGGKGALVIFAAGNSNRELVAGELYSLPEVVTVGAVNNFDEAAPFSNHGAEVDLTAPTGSLTLDLQGAAGESPTDITNLFGGTSAACPVVAGIAALLYSAKEDATADEVRAALVKSARKAPYATPDAKGHDPLYGYGIVDPTAAIALLVGPKTLPAIDPTLGSKPAACGCDTSSLTLPLFILLVLLHRTRRHTHVVVVADHF